MRIFLFHPTPQLPQPSLDATIRCYDSSVKGINLQKKMYDEKTIEFTWVYLHQIYTATLTLIWTLYNDGVRELHSKEDVESNFEISLSLLTVLAERWPGTEAAADLFARLAQAALQNYTTNQEKSPRSIHSSLASHSTATSPSPQKESPPMHHHRSSPNPNSPQARPVEESTPSPETPTVAPWEASFPGVTIERLMQMGGRNNQPVSEIPQALQDLIFNPNARYGMFPDRTDTGVCHSAPAFITAWDPPNHFSQNCMATPDMHALATAPIQQSIGDLRGPSMLNPQQQQNELTSILKNEAMETFDNSRPWGVDYDSQLHFY